MLCFIFSPFWAPSDIEGSEFDLNVTLFEGIGSGGELLALCSGLDTSESDGNSVLQNSSNLSLETSDLQAEVTHSLIGEVTSQLSFLSTVLRGMLDGGLLIIFSIPSENELTWERRSICELESILGMQWLFPYSFTFGMLESRDWVFSPPSRIFLGRRAIAGLSFSIFFREEGVTGLPS